MNEKLSFMPSLTDAYVIGMKNVGDMVDIILSLIDWWIQEFDDNTK